MATRTKKSKQSQFGGVQFVNYKMDTKTQKQFNEWFSGKPDEVVAAIHETCQDDNKIGLSWSTEAECFIAAMTGKEDSLNAGKCLTLRSKDWFKAMAAVAFVHTVVFSGEIWDVNVENDLL